MGGKSALHISHLKLLMQIFIQAAHVSQPLGSKPQHSCSLLRRMYFARMQRHLQIGLHSYRAVHS